MGNRQTGTAENQTSLDHLTSNPRYQSALRDIYSSNSSIPAFPGTFLASDFDELNANRNTPVSMKKTTPIKSDFLFEKNSVSFAPTGTPNMFDLTFKFSCRTNIQITIYFRAQEVVDNEMRTEGLSIEEKYLGPQTFNFEAGKDQVFPSGAVTLNTKAYPKDDLFTVQTDQYPLIIKIESKIEGLEIPKAKLYTYYTLKCPTPEKCEAKLFKQKFEYKNKSYLLDDIYGLTSSEKSLDTIQDNKDCSICLVNKLNTVVLPCKHICLCVDCAKNLRFRNNQRCPICRKIVETFLILKKNKKHYE